MTAIANLTPALSYTKNTALRLGARLVPIDLEQPQERQILYQQRVICGWNKDKVATWQASIARGERTMFWITLPPSDKTAAVPPIQRGSDTIFAVGHVSLDLVDTPDTRIAPDLSLASGDGSIMQITTLFVLPEFSALGLGAFAMDECERLAQEEPYGRSHCHAITVTTLSSRYLANGVEGPEGKGRWASADMEMPVRDNAIWYARRGYVLYKEVIRYFSPGPNDSTITWYACCMRKELGKQG